ncbi:MAG: hypothetical protein ACI87E_000371 [Mariniblastus sp.]|jgi:hypothetical protein
MSMLVYLKVEEGPHAGRRIDLRSGQTAVIGNTDWADFCFEDDTSMAGSHFQLIVQASVCQFKHIDANENSQINGVDVEVANLVDGDLIEAGQTRFRVQIDRQNAEHVANPIEEAESEPEEELEDLIELCAYLELSDEAHACAAGLENRQDLLNELTAAKLYNDAIRLQADSLPKQIAVKWGVDVIHDLVANSLPPKDRPAVDSAAQWAGDPTEENRRAAEEQAESAAYSGIGGAIAAAAFYSGGSIAAADLEHDVEPDTRATGQAVTVALVLAVATQIDSESERHFAEILKQAPKTPS